MGVIDGRVAVITGGARGIGASISRLFAQEGASLVINDLGGAADGSGGDAGPAEQIAGEITAAGGTAAFAPADVSQREPTVAAIRQVAAELGPVDLLVANAGVGAPTVVEPAFNVADVEKMFRVNLFGVVYAIEAVLPEMLRRGRGHVAAVSSMAAYRLSLIHI